MAGQNRYSTWNSTVNLGIHYIIFWALIDVVQVRITIYVRVICFFGVTIVINFLNV